MSVTARDPQRLVERVYEEIAREQLRVIDLPAPQSDGPPVASPRQ